MNLVENLKQSLSEIELDYVAFLKAAGVLCHWVFDSLFVGKFMLSLEIMKLPEETF
jgi:hypothetical protein